MWIIFTHADILQPHFLPVKLNKTSDSPSTWLSWVTFTPESSSIKLDNSVRLQPPASDLCSPSGRLFILLTFLMLLFHLLWLPSFTSQEGNSSFHTNPCSPSTRSHWKHTEPQSSPGSCPLTPPTNPPRKILALDFSLLLNQTCPWPSVTGHAHRESSFPHTWIKAPGVYPEKRQQSLRASFKAQH